MAGRDRLLRTHLRERFVVTLRNGEGFEGLLLDADDKTVKLTDAFVVGQGRKHSVDGELYLARAEVLYLQKAVAP